MSVDSLSDVDASALEETGALLGMPEIQNQRQTVSWPVSLPVTTKGWARMCFWLLQSLVTAFSAILAIWTIWVYFPSTLTLDTTETNLLAKTVNGTYAGLYHVKYDQVLFLGMPYARPPLGDLRLRPPKFLNQTWEGYRNATSYGPQCMGYKDHHFNYPKSEDCLTINVVRPASSSGITQSKLPVAVYLYGGSHVGSGANDPRYNMSALIAHATKNGLAFIGVTLNYRSGPWGLIAGREVQGTRNNNIGLHDQRLALHWIQENIEGFGGDPRRVTLWGASSGAEDVGLHLTAYDGREDGLFRAAILQSGGPVTPTGIRWTPADDLYHQLIETTSCRSAEDPLSCLRTLDVDVLDAAFNSSVGMFMSLPAMDGDFVRGYGSLSLKMRKVAKVPILSMTVTNEGASYIPADMHTLDDLRRHLIESRRYPETFVDRILPLYQREHKMGGSAQIDARALADLVLGDLEIKAGQRALCEAYSQIARCYSLRFDAIPNRRDDQGKPQFVAHGAEIAPLFQNFDGMGWEPGHNPFSKASESYYDMARTLGLLWASFITHSDPNTGRKGAEDQVMWLGYSVDRPVNLVLNESGVPWVEPDTYRAEAIKVINEVQHSILDK